MQTRSTFWVDRFIGFALPKLPGDTPTQRDKKRYARNVSIFALTLIILTIATLPSDFSLDSPVAKFAPLFVILFELVTLLLNRWGFVFIAGSLCVLTLLVGIMVPTVMPRTIGLVDLSVYFWYIVPVIIVGMLLPPIVIFPVSAISIGIACFTILTYPSEPDLKLMLTRSPAAIFLPVVTLQVVVAVLAYVLLSTLLREIRRADRAEDIAALQRTVADFERTQAEDKKRLEESIQHIAHVHSLVANGQLDVRVSLQETNVLWSVAVPLNNLLNRAQNWKYSADQEERTRQIAELLVRQLQDARRQGIRPTNILGQRTGTVLDPLLLECNTWFRSTTLP